MFNRSSAVLFATATIALLTGCQSPDGAPSAQQTYLKGLATEDSQLARFRLNTGLDGRTAYLDVLRSEPEAAPMAAIRAFLLVARKFDETAYDQFELRYRGETRLKFLKADVVALTRMHGVEDRSLTVLREVLARAHGVTAADDAAVTRVPAQAPADDAARALRVFTTDMQAFLNRWFLADERPTRR